MTVFKTYSKVLAFIFFKTSLFTSSEEREFNTPENKATNTQVTASIDKDNEKSLRSCLFTHLSSSTFLHPSLWLCWLQMGLPWLWESRPGKLSREWWQSLALPSWVQDLHLRALWFLISFIQVLKQLLEAQLWSPLQSCCTKETSSYSKGMKQENQWCFTHPHVLSSAQCWISACDTDRAATTSPPAFPSHQENSTLLQFHLASHTVSTSTQGFLSRILTWWSHLSYLM